MKTVVIILIAASLLLGIALPRYLAPNDLASCSGPGTGKCAPADAIVAISGGDTNARVDEALDLYRAKWAGILIFSGAASDRDSPSNASAMRSYAEGKGVPAADILIDEDARSTNQNATNVARIASEKGYTRIILVTSGYHERRASLEFIKATGPSVTIVSHPVESDNQWSNWWWATPAGWWLSIGELVKIGAFYVGIG